MAVCEVRLDRVLAKLLKQGAAFGFGDIHDLFRRAVIHEKDRRVGEGVGDHDWVDTGRYPVLLRVGEGL